MDAFEFAKEIQRNRVHDEEYIKVSEMGGIPDDHYTLLSGQRIGGNTTNLMVGSYQSQKFNSPNVTMEFQRSAKRKAQKGLSTHSKMRRSSYLNSDVSSESGMTGIKTE